MALYLILYPRLLADWRARVRECARAREKALRLKRENNRERIPDGSLRGDSEDGFHPPFNSSSAKRTHLRFLSTDTRLFLSPFLPAPFHPRGTLGFGTRFLFIPVLGSLALLLSPSPHRRLNNLSSEPSIFQPFLHPCVARSLRRNSVSRVFNLAIAKRLGVLLGDRSARESSRRIRPGGLQWAGEGWRGIEGSKGKTTFADANHRANEDAGNQGGGGGLTRRRKHKDSSEWKGCRGWC